MKKNILTLIALLSLSVVGYSVNYTSAGAGPAAWNVATSWSPNGIPTNVDNVTISAGHIITINSLQTVLNVTLNGTLKGSTGMNLTIKGNYTNNGAEAGVGNINFATAGFNISGTGTFISGITFTFNASSSRTITAGTIVDKTSGLTLQVNSSIINLGTVTAGTVTAKAGTSFINSTNATLTLTKANFMAGRTFDATASGNTVNIKYSGSAIPSCTGSTYYNLNFNGTVAQTLTGLAGTTTIENLTVNNTLGVKLTSGTYTVNGALTLSNGTFNLNALVMTLTSVPGKYARFAPLAGTGAITNATNFKVQRFITARDTTWCDMSSPVVTTIQDWDNTLFFSYPHDPYGTPEVYSNILAYSEPAADYVQVSAATALTAGKGIEIFLTDDAAYNGFTATTVTTTGKPNTGTQNIALSYTAAVAPYSGQNLVGNPFASAINTAGITFTNASSTVDVFDYVAQDYTSHPSGFILGPGQGFWVYATSAGASIAIPEAAKNASTNTDLKSVQPIEPFLKLVLSSSDGSLPYEYTLKIAADANASDGWDEKDHPFRKSPSHAAVSLTSLLDDGKKLSINTFNSSNDEYSMPLESHVGVSSYYKIEASGFEFIPDYTCIKLEDKLLGKMVDLSNGAYSFKMNSTDRSDRFVVHFSKNGNCKMAASTINSNFSDLVEVLPSAQGNVINFNLSETTNTVVTLTNMLGQTLVDPISVEANTQSLNISLPEGFSGMYIVKIESAKGTVTKKFVRK